MYVYKISHNQKPLSTIAKFKEISLTNNNSKLLRLHNYTILNVILIPSYLV